MIPTKSDTSSILLNVDSYSSVEVSLFQKFIADRFSNAVSNIDSTVKNIEKFIIELNKEEYKFKVVKYNISATNFTHIIIADDYSFMYFIDSDNEENVRVSTYGNSLLKTEEMFNIFKPFQTVNDSIYVKVSTYFIGRNGLEKSSSYKEEKDLSNVSKLYYPFLDVDEMFKQFILSSESILLLGGKPGTGKTNIINLMLDYSIKNYDLFNEEDSDSEELAEDKIISAAYVKNVDILALDEFWNELNSNKYDFIILDDIDYMLIDRNISSEYDEVRKKFISQLLSYTDGVFENKTKFIITSNQDITKIDKAILRKGRTFNVLQFRDLSNKEALNIWLEANLPEKEFYETVKNDYITACDLGSFIELKKAMNEKGSEQKKYILEDNISVYDLISPESNIDF